MIMIVITGLFISGLTAIPVDSELSFLLKHVSPDSELSAWLFKVLTAYREISHSYPFLIYGYDWLAFAHLVIAVAFIGPYLDPVKNIWVIQFGMIACVMVVPLALIAGEVRDIPIFWRVIDCSFGVLGILPLYFCYRLIRKLELMNQQQTKTIHTI